MKYRAAGMPIPDAREQAAAEHLLQEGESDEEENPPEPILNQPLSDPNNVSDPAHAEWLLQPETEDDRDGPASESVHDNQPSFRIDHDFLTTGMTMTAFYIEGGVRKLADIIHMLAEDADVEVDKLRPYVRTWYEAARTFMEDAGEDTAGMDTPEEARAAIKALAGNTNAERTGVQPPTPEVPTGEAAGDVPGAPGEREPGRAPDAGGPVGDGDVRDHLHCDGDGQGPADKLPGKGGRARGNSSRGGGNRPRGSRAPAAPGPVEEAAAEAEESREQRTERNIIKADEPIGEGGPEFKVSANIGPKLALSAAGAVAVAVAIAWAVLVGIGPLIDASLIALGSVWMILGPVQFLVLLVSTLIVALLMVGAVVGGAAILEARLAPWRTKPCRIESSTSQTDSWIAEVGELANKFAIFGGMALVGLVAWVFILAASMQETLSGGLALKAVWLDELMPLAVPTALAVAGIVLGALVPPKTNKLPAEGDIRDLGACPIESAGAYADWGLAAGDENGNDQEREDHNPHCVNQ